MRIGVYCEGFIGWAGGIDFLRLLVESLVCLDRTDIEIHFLVPDRGPLWQARRVRSVVGHVLNCARAGQFQALPRRPSPAFISDSLGEHRNPHPFHRIDAGRRSLAMACKKTGIDIIFPAFFSLGRDFPTPWIGYMADFQHKYYPEYFKQKEIRVRNAHFHRIGAEARIVVVNAKAVAEDVARFVPHCKAQVVAMPLAAAPDKDWLTAQPGVAARYGIGEKYFMISNQFWLHKRHDIAFQAFQVLAQRVPDVQLVCTGHTEDGRDPDYFPNLLKFLEANGLESRVKILGLIPKRDQIEVMKGSVAVVQPTAFEGGPGGGSVYDALALGVPTIVSDIPINREIESWVTAYFPLGDAEALCRAMLEALERPHLRPTDEQLREQGRSRRRDCGEVLLALLSEGISSS